MRHCHTFEHAENNIFVDVYCNSSVNSGDDIILLAIRASFKFRLKNISMEV